MRKITLAAALLGVMLLSSGPAIAGTVLGWHRARSCGFGAPTAAYPYPYAYPYAPYAPVPYYSPYDFGPSYFRPDAPRAWNAQRNWRDTWQDDGVKVHSYTFR